MLTPNFYSLNSAAAQLKHIFQAIAPDHCPALANFHMHTFCSDGQLDPEALVQQAVFLGLRNLAITDHHTINGYRHAHQWLRHHGATANTSVLPKLWPGLEVNAGLLDIEVHILCYAFVPDHPALQPYVQGEAATGDDYDAAQVIDAIHQAGGLAVLAHPARYRRSPADLIGAAAAMNLDGVESYYAYDNPEPWRPSPKQTEIVYQLGEQYGLFHTCGTDTHGESLLKRL
ncbi:MAG: PHP domain-containing protein [Elainellaceae cyanobacterium]